MAEDQETLSVRRATSALRRSWPALDERRIGGWSLGFSEGFTRRANSVWMLGQVSDVAAAIGAVEEAYRVRGLPSRFFTTDSSDPGEVAALKGFGYVASLTGRILVRGVSAPRVDASAERVDGTQRACDSTAPVVSTAGPELPPEWRDAWLRWNGRTLPSDQRLAPGILGANTPTFLGVRVERELVALARVTVTDRTGIIDCLVTESASRGRGYGRLLIEHAQQVAGARGATSCLAMVVDGNAASLRLFERTGFTELGAFRYLDAPERFSCC
ncbi:MAG: GNAT family N-acetyltransferase [Pseudoclavibacter sp.]